MPTLNALTIEKLIASAHKSLSYAIARASTMRDLGLHDDLQLIQLELERLQVDLLRGPRRRRSRHVPDDDRMYPGLTGKVKR